MMAVGVNSTYTVSGKLSESIPLDTLNGQLRWPPVGRFSSHRWAGCLSACGRNYLALTTEADYATVASAEDRRLNPARMTLAMSWRRAARNW